MRKMRFLGKGAVQRALSSWAEARSRPNGFSTITRASSVQPASCNLPDHERKHARRNRQVVGRTRTPDQLRPELREGAGVVVVAVHIAQPRHQRRKRVLVFTAVLRDRGVRAGDQLIPGPRRFGDAHHREIELAATRQSLKRRKNLLVGEVARGAEKHEGVRTNPRRRAGHRLHTDAIANQRVCRLQRAAARGSTPVAARPPPIFRGPSGEACAAARSPTRQRTSAEPARRRLCSSVKNEAPSGRRSLHG